MLPSVYRLLCGVPKTSEFASKAQMVLHVHLFKIAGGGHPGFACLPEFGSAHNK
jgi:hypothetical protein